MVLHRRQLLQLTGAMIAAPAITTVAWAQTYPTRPVRIVAGYPPGGLADLYARLLGQSLSERLGKPFIVENRAGAAGSLAAESVARAAPDGHTLLLTTATDAWNTAVYDNLRFDYLRDVEPIASIAHGMAVLVVNPSFPAKSIPELIAYAKSKLGFWAEGACTCRVLPAAEPVRRGERGSHAKHAAYATGGGRATSFASRRRF